MDKVTMVKNAIHLAKKQGVLFKKDTPSFRPINTDQKERFHIEILTNTSPNSTGHAIIDEHLNILDPCNEIKLANYLIDIFNGLNIELKVKKLIEKNDS